MRYLCQRKWRCTADVAQKRGHSTLAAGYDLSTAASYERTLVEFDELIGLQRLAAFHLNNAKKGLGSRVDRHAHIGQGLLGPEPFRRLIQDKRF